MGFISKIKIVGDEEMQEEEVKRILRVTRPQWVSEESWEQEISNLPLAWRRFAGLMNINWTDQRFTEIFGSCLATLEEDDFLKLFRMRNLYFHLPEKLAEVNGFSKGKNTSVTVVVFSPDLLLLSDVKIRGIVGHELGHIFEGHHLIQDSRPHAEIELEADQKAAALGFQHEIEEYRGRSIQKKED